MSSRASRANFEFSRSVQLQLYADVTGSDAGCFPQQLFSLTQMMEIYFHISHCSLSSSRDVKTPPRRMLEEKQRALERKFVSDEGRFLSWKFSFSCGVPLKCAWSVCNDNLIFTWRQRLNSPGRNLLVDFHKRKIHVYNNSRICVTRSTARQFNKTTQFTMSYTAKMFVCTIFFCFFFFIFLLHRTFHIQLIFHRTIIISFDKIHA